MSVTQYVNLYRPVAAPRGVLTLPRMGRLLAVLAVVLAAYSLARGWQLSHLERQVAELETRRDEMVTRLEESRRHAVAPQVAALREQVTRLGLEKQQRAQVLERLKQGGFGNLTGFSDHLQGFARQRIEGLWLTGIRLSAGGEQMALTGLATHEALMPDFIGRLGAEPRLSGLTFRHVLLKRTEDAAAPIAFELNTESQEPAPRPSAAPRLELPRLELPR